jgi:molecular chaperone GrpE
MMPQPEAEKNEKQPESVAPEIPAEEIAAGEDLPKVLAEEKARAEEYLASLQRERADFLNYKRRCEQEKEDIFKYGSSELILKILPILDDFERAFNHIPHDEAKASWVKGMKALERKFRSLLEGEGLTEIKALGETFDPNLHDAVIQAEGNEGIIVKEFEKGYKLKDRVIRHSKVAVGNGQHESNKEE